MNNTIRDQVVSLELEYIFITIPTNENVSWELKNLSRYPSNNRWHNTSYMNLKEASLGFDQLILIRSY